MKTKRTKIQAYISVDIVKLVDDEAAKRNISRQKIMEDALTRYFEAKTLAELMPGFLTDAILKMRSEDRAAELIATLTETAENTEKAA